MKLFEILAESRIREWQQRPEAEKNLRCSGHEERVSYETQAIAEIESLLLESRETQGEARTDLLRQADNRTVELLTLLERRGYSLTAKLVGDRISDLRKRSSQG